MRRAPLWLKVAAGLVLLAGTAIVGRSLLPSSQGVSHLVHEDLAELSVDQLTEVLATLDQTLDDPQLSAPSDLEDLTEQQLEDVLEDLLRELEG